MFFDSRLMKSRSIGSVWKSAHNFKESGDESGPSFHKICTKLEKWVQSEEQVASKRLSLRTSSTLVSGAAKLYKRKLEELLTDLQYTADSMRDAKCRRRQNRQSSNDQDQDSRSTGSKTLADMSIGDHSSSSLARQLQDPHQEYQELNTEMVEEMDISPNDHGEGSQRVAPENSGQDRSKTVNSYSHCSSTVTRKNANTQTSLKDVSTEEVDPDAERGEAESLPFACVSIYKNNKTAVPTQILLSSVNPKILKIYPENRGEDRSKTVNSYSHRSSTVTRKNANTQTSLKDVSTDEVDPDAERGEAESLPFVCVTIYKNNKTAVPTQILLSSVNPKILKIYPENRGEDRSKTVNSYSHRSSTVTRKNANTQTSLKDVSTEEVNPDAERGEAESLPFACVTIYKNNKTAVPTQILLSSVNPKILKIYPENRGEDRSKTVNSYSHRSSTVTRKNANTQTSLKDVSTDEVDPDAERGEAESLPFVCVTIYKNNKTAVPTQILLSSVNPKILKIYPENRGEDRSKTVNSYSHRSSTVTRKNANTQTSLKDVSTEEVNPDAERGEAESLPFACVTIYKNNKTAVPTQILLSSVNPKILKIYPENRGEDRSKTVNSYSHRSSTVTRKNANTQTSLKDVSTDEVDPDAERGEAESLPFVCVTIYKNNKTAVPTQILLSSVNPKILKIYPENRGEDRSKTVNSYSHRSSTVTRKNANTQTSLKDVSTEEVNPDAERGEAESLPFACVTIYKNNKTAVPTQILLSSVNPKILKIYPENRGEDRSKTVNSYSHRSSTVTRKNANTQTSLKDVSTEEVDPDAERGEAESLPFACVTIYKNNKTAVPTQILLSSVNPKILKIYPENRGEDRSKTVNSYSHRSSTVTRKNANTQSSLKDVSTEEVNPDAERGEAESLPFACVTIYKNNKTAVPTQILLSSVNHKILKIYPENRGEDRSKTVNSYSHRSSTVTRKNANTQTSLKDVSTEEVDPDAERGEAESLPFACVTIYKNNKTAVPTQILLSSVNPKILKIYPENRGEDRSKTVNSYSHRSSTVTRKNANTQTSLKDVSTEEVDSDAERGEAESLPFVRVTIYKNNKTAVPTQILLSSVNPKILKCFAD